MQHSFLNRIKNFCSRQKRLLAACAVRRRKLILEPELKIVADGLKERAGSFTGLYEPIYQVSRGAAKFASPAFGEWCLRVENMGSDDPFSRVFLALFSGDQTWDQTVIIQRAGLMVHCFAMAGVIRDDRRTLIADADTEEWYSSWDGEDLSTGETYQVKKPCWVYKKQLMERGLLIQKKTRQNV